ncbi:hypothetical protein [Brumicola pallidula]|jgi:hypothetical protein|uniref:Glycosyltransferase 2-like domain-containing protein n=1 Tax=Brumicola pallidula DSM 14239 = ACAM 615 TaxID=1121922 RepID=K7A2Q3_9ALTE|nr:hypothetical protein [Glaciecola pallidula]GAC29765.1 hypothetical protein GPAL_2914 [Glaciecola pallidula DSM 14239 = ACAM 615]
MRSLKEYYWLLESFIYESYARGMRVKRALVMHNLEAPLIVSFTSYPPRFAKLHLTIKSILNQSIRPDKIMLWVAEADFAALTDEVLLLSKNNNDFEIKCCENIRSYKKLIPTLTFHPEAFVAIADDDAYYSTNWLHQLTSCYTDSSQIIAHRTHKVAYDTNCIFPYQQWAQTSNGTNNDVLMATGVGGVLYPPGCFNEKVLEKDLFMELCPTADDIWFFWMSRINGVKTVMTPHKTNTVCWIGTHDSGLAQTNVAHNGNDVCLNNLINSFGLDEILDTFPKKSKKEH